jgi:hypothetical protein
MNDITGQTKKEPGSGGMTRVHVRLRGLVASGEKQGNPDFEMGLFGVPVFL